MCSRLLSFDDKALCPECMKAYENHKNRNCSRCAKKLDSCSCTTKYLDSHYIKEIYKVYRYSKTKEQTPWNYLIYSLKQDNRRDVVDFLSSELYNSVINNNEDILSKREEYIITNVPRRPDAIREYGYDHSKDLAKKLAKRLGIKYLSLLKSKTKKAQKSTLADQRIKNVKLDYHKRNINLKNKRVIIVDDIITTGASMGAAATLIRGLGTKKISAAAVSIAYHDMYKPFLLPYQMKKYKSKYYFNRKKRTYIR